MALININLATSEDNVDMLNDIIKIVFVLIMFHVCMCAIYGGTPFYLGGAGGIGNNLFNDDFINVLISLAFSFLAYNIVLKKVVKIQKGCGRERGSD